VTIWAIGALLLITPMGATLGRKSLALLFWPIVLKRRLASHRPSFRNRAGLGLSSGWSSARQVRLLHGLEPMLRNLKLLPGSLNRRRNAVESRAMPSATKVSTLATHCERHRRI
jgi:hypothetical protein